MADPKVTWRIGVDDNVTRTLKGIDGQLAGLTKGFRTLGGFAGFAAVTAGITRMVGAVVDLSSELQDASDKLGVSAVELQRLKGAAEATGASFDSIQTALVFLAKTTGAANKGSKEAAESFRLLGISADKLANLDLDRRLAVIATQLQKIPDAGTRAELAVRVLGRGAADLLPLLGNLDTELKKVNVTLSDEQVKALDDAGDAWEAFKRDSITGTGIAIGTLLTQLQKVAEKAGGLFSGGVFPGAMPSRESMGMGRGGTGRPGGGRGQGGLSAEEAAAIIGLPGRKSVDEAFAIIKKAMEDSEDFLGKQLAREHHTSLAGTESLERLADAASSWNDELALQAQILQDIEPPIETYRKAMEQITRLNSEGLLTDDQALAAQKKALEDLAATAEETSTVVTGKTDQILKEIKNATQGFASDITSVLFDATQSIGDMFANLAQRIAEAFVQTQVVQPWLDAAFGLFGSLSVPQTIDMSKLPQRRALGGAVSGGGAFFVGESGPELFVPRTAGTIVPNGMSAGPTIHFNISTPDPRAAAAILVANERTIINIVNKAMQRAGRNPTLA